MIRLAVALALFVVTGPARAESLLLALSSQTITIASNYAGADVTLFGTVKPDEAGGTRRGPYDLVVTTRGPSEAITVREKARTAGLWLNHASRKFKQAPSFLSVLSTAPIDDVTNDETLKRAGLGLSALVVPGKTDDDKALAGALLRIQQRRGLWREEPTGVSFLDGSLFRATIRLPPNVPIGSFEVDAQLLSGGAEVGRAKISFNVVKDAFEARVATVAETQRLAYGLATAALALLFGWGASVMFRRD